MGHRDVWMNRTTEAWSSTSWVKPLPTKRSGRSCSTRGAPGRGGSPQEPSALEFEKIKRRWGHRTHCNPRSCILGPFRHSELPHHVPLRREPPRGNAPHRRASLRELRRYLPAHRGASPLHGVCRSPGGGVATCLHRGSWASLGGRGSGRWKWEAERE